RNICIGLSGAIVVIAIVIVILALTVFKKKDPITTVNSVTLQDLDVSFDISRLKVYVNLTLDFNLSVKNPNKVSFKYTNSSAFLYYRGQIVGEVPIPADQMSADATKVYNLTATILADRLLSAFSDVMAGQLPLNIYSQLSGKVRIFNIFNIHVKTSSSCDFTIFVSNRTVSDQQCHYKTKL
ncbi:LEA_2 domain-containing protein, partial [Cephalotus follicularis]